MARFIRTSTTAVFTAALFLLLFCRHDGVALPAGVPHAAPPANSHSVLDAERLPGARRLTGYMVIH